MLIITQILDPLPFSAPPLYFQIDFACLVDTGAEPLLLLPFVEYSDFIRTHDEAFFAL